MFYHTRPGEFSQGDRIALHPCLDLFMMGVRYGEVLRTGKKFVVVRLDSIKGNREFRFTPDLLAIV